MTDYRVRFSATPAGPVAEDVEARLEGALTAMPGIAAVGHVDSTGVQEGVGATFWIDVRLGMADAARDGSRLAKEALKVAGMGEAQLVELAVTMTDRPGG
jgi:hypothetical protein